MCHLCEFRSLRSGQKVSTTATATPLLREGVKSNVGDRDFGSFVMPFHRRHSDDISPGFFCT